MISRTTPAQKQFKSLPIQQLIPWWDALDASILANLKLPPVGEESLQFVDVAIIGGGVAGLSAALSVKKRAASAKVVVLEKEEMLGYGATGRNAGILTPGINMGMAELPPGSQAASFYPETTSIFHTLIEEATTPGTILSTTQTGAFNLAVSMNAARKLEREAHTRVSAGLCAEIWTPSQVAEATYGRLNVQSVVRALWLPDEGRIQPLSLLAYLAKQARNGRAVRIVGKAKIIRYHVIDEKVKRHCWELTLADYADYRPGNGRLGVSGGRYGKAGVTKKDATYYRHLADATRYWLPELASKEPIFTWAVDLTVTADMIPELRVVSDKAPGVAIEGLGAHGVLPGMVLAQQADEYIVSRLAS